VDFQTSFSIFYAGSLYAIDCNNFLYEPRPANRFGSQSLKEILKNSILWAVPKSRRTIAKRLKRRFGVPDYVWKPHVAKTNILMCVHCGHNYEAGHLCGKIDY